MAIADGALTGRGDAALVRRMAQGDPDAARVVYETHCDPLLRFVARRVKGTLEDAEEITNDIFLAAVDIGHTYDGSCSEFTWLCSLARNRILDFRRRASAAKRVPENQLMRIDHVTKEALRDLHDPSVSLEKLVEKMDRVRLVQSLLDSLSPEQREAVTMRYVEGFSVAEIARVMKRSERAVERLLERAKEKPRREILRWLGESGFRSVCLELLIL